jgi:hypothetical protein
MTLPNWKMAQDGTGQIYCMENLQRRQGIVESTQRMHASTRRINTAIKARVGDGTARARDKKSKVACRFRLWTGVQGTSYEWLRCTCMYSVQDGTCM